GFKLPPRGSGGIPRAGDVVAGVSIEPGECRHRGTPARRRACCGLHAVYAQPDDRLLLLRAAPRHHRSRHHRGGRNDAPDVGRHGATERQRPAAAHCRDGGSRPRRKDHAAGPLACTGEVISPREAVMDFSQAVVSGFRKYANSHGRASRSEYWCWTLFSLLVDIVAMLVDRFAFPQVDWGPVGVITGLFLFLPGLAVSIRRLHDIDRSGYWVLLMMTIVLIPLLLYWACVKGTTGDNDFGPDPLAAPGGSADALAVAGGAS